MTDTIYFGGGCFWCIEAVFARVNGVISAVSGYMGGSVADPDYEIVCMGNSGHAEVVKVTFNPNQVGLRELLKIFFTVHDPTTLNCQGSDIGTQYRSVIFYTSDEQRTETAQAITELMRNKVFPKPIVTAVEPASEFYKAEDYHQSYFENNPDKPYCQYVVAPKVEKLEHFFPESLKAS